MDISEILFKRIKPPVLILLLFAIVTCGTDVFANSFNEQISDALRNRLEVSTDPHMVVCMGDQLCGVTVLHRFYGLRNFSPVWIAENVVSTRVYELVRAIQGALDEGINPQDYHFEAINILLEEVEDPYLGIDDIPIEKFVELELLLSDAFFLYASHLTSGRVDPETTHTEWAIKTQNLDLVQILIDSLDKDNFINALETVNRQSPDYLRLKKISTSYRKLVKNGGWPYIPNGPKMKKGDKGTRVAVLRSRLLISGDLGQNIVKKPEIFGDDLKKAVLKFQKRHGLTEDGIVGRATIAALNVTASERLKQIMVNMERRRWIQRDFGSRYIIVNIADYQLRVVEENKNILKMRVVVGKDYRQTPVFEGIMTYIVINPFWNIPKKLVEEDLLPIIIKDKEVIKRKNIKVYEGWKNGSSEIDPESINWKEVNKNGCSYKLVQGPGPLNALGRIKFIFPNKFDVYLHDTPDRNLFSREKRDYSSGCIRIEKPVELASYLLQNDAGWSKQKILDAIDSKETQAVWLLNPISVKILYFTAWVDEQDIVHFRDDIYQRDKLVAKALEERSPFRQKNHSQ